MPRIDFLSRHPEHTDQVADWIFDSWGDGTPEGRNRARQRVRERLAEDAVPLTLVALDADVPVGTVSLFVSDLDGFDELTPWLAALYVTPTARTSGVGTLLVDRIVELAGELGYERVFLQAQQAAEYYATRGWERIDEAVTDRGLTTVMARSTRDLPVLLYRADGGFSIGLGHVAHAAKLADVLLAANVATVRLIGRFDSPSREWLATTALGLPLDVEAGSSEIDAVLAAVERLGAAAVAINFPRELLETADPLFEALRAAGVPQLHFDNPMRGVEKCDLAINALPHPDWGVDAAALARVHEGLDYFLLSKDMEERSRCIRERSGQVNRILVAMGGSDPAQLTQRVLDALSLAGYSGVANVVVGAANPGLRSLESLASNLPFEVTVHGHVPSLTSLIAESDLGISALGLTTYEMAALGLPTIIIAPSQFNASVGNAYAERGAAVSLGYHDEWQPEELASRIAELLADSESLRAMSEIATQVVDGKGASRVVALVSQLLGTE